MSASMSSGTGTSAVDRLHALRHTLGTVGEDSKYASYRTARSAIYVSCQLPYQDGQLLGQGIPGRDVDLEAAGLSRARLP